MKLIKTRPGLSLYFPIKGVDPISLSPIVFPKVEIILMYMELNETIKTEKVLVCKQL